MAFISKSLTSADTHYINVEREVLGILNGLEKCHHYYFTCEVRMIMDHKLLIAICKKDVTSLSHRLQRITQYTNTVQTAASVDHHRLAIHK